MRRASAVEPASGGLEDFRARRGGRQLNAPFVSQPSSFSAIAAADYGYDFIPQGAVDPHQTHRCPGERFPVAIALEARRRLVEQMSYTVPEQDLDVPCGHMRGRLKQGFLIQDVETAP